MGQRGCSVVTPVGTPAWAVAGMLVGAVMVEAGPSGPSDFGPHPSSRDNATTR